LEETELKAKEDVVSRQEDEKNENKEDTNMYELKKRKSMLDKISEFGLKDCKRYAMNTFRVNERMKSESNKDTKWMSIAINGRK